MNLSPRQWSAIHAAQARELDRLLTDRIYAQRASQLAHYSAIGRWIPPGRGRVLEIGCGPGRYVAILAQLGHEVAGCDPIPYDTWAKFKGFPSVALLSNVRAEMLPFPDAHFDHVACMGALLYFNDPTVGLSEIHRILKPRGRLVLRTVNRWNLRTLFTGEHLDPAAPNHYAPAELAAFLSCAGFRVHRLCTYGFWPPFGDGAWWYISNCVLPLWAQSALSRLTPRPFRVSTTVFAERSP